MGILGWMARDSWSPCSQNPGEAESGPKLWAAHTLHLSNSIVVFFGEIADNGLVTSSLIWGSDGSQRLGPIFQDLAVKEKPFSAESHFHLEMDQCLSKVVYIFSGVLSVLLHPPSAPQQYFTIKAP